MRPGPLLSRSPGKASLPFLESPPFGYPIRTLRKRRLLVTTETELKAMAAAA